MIRHFLSAEARKDMYSFFTLVFLSLMLLVRVVSIIPIVIEDKKVNDHINA